MTCIISQYCDGYVTPYNASLVLQRDIGRIHGKDERISVEEYRKEIEFYTLVIKLGEQSTLECHSDV